ncbi:unnamed protein product, partial [marine sediment metagenome]
MAKIIVFSPTSTRFDGGSLDRGVAVSGAETVIIQTMKHMAKVGHEVIVYCPCEEEGVYDGVQYKEYMFFDKDKLECDLYILNRRIWNLPVHIKYKKAAVFSQDVFETPCWEGINYLKKSKIDAWIFLSKFHRMNVMESVKDIPLDKTYIIGNGVPDYLLNMSKKKVYGQLIYSSVPF